jgi:hypothetical protein
MGRYYWECTADPNHKSADWRPAWSHHWNTKHCSRCGYPMRDVRGPDELKRLMASSEAYRRGEVKGE